MKLKALLLKRFTIFLILPIIVISASPSLVQYTISVAIMKNGEHFSNSNPPWLGEGWRLQDDDRVQGVGDFNGDGRSDFIIRSETHLGIVGLDNSGRPTSVAIVGNDGRFGEGWRLQDDDRVQGVGDFNGDGRSDFIIRSETHLGIVGLDNSGRPISVAIVGNDGRFGEGWRLQQTDTVQAVGNFNGDDRSDFIIRSKTHLGIVGLIGEASCGRPKRIPSDYPAGLDKCYIHTFSIAGVQKRVIVYYAEIPELDTTPRDGINDWAIKVGGWTAAAWKAFADYGFRSPARSTDDRGVEEVEIWIYPRGQGGGLAPCEERYIIVNAETIDQDEQGLHQVVIHELFHATQQNHISICGGNDWLLEGTAQIMQDHTDDTIDTIENGLKGCAKAYLETPEDDITTQPNECEAALWWKYFMERFGTDRRELQQGVDALVDFFDFLSRLPSEEKEVEKYMELLDMFIRTRGSDLDSTWCDFAVANYVKNLGGSRVPSRYRYQDEAQPPGPYDFDDDPTTPPVNQDLNRSLDIGRSLDGSITNASPWAARYYRVHPAREVSVIEVNFRQDTDQRVCYSLLVIDRDDLVQEIREVGRDFRQMIPNNEYDEIIVIVTTFSDAVNYQYSIRGTR